MNRISFRHFCDSSEIIQRSEPCRICGQAAGIRIGEADYWDLQTSGIILCDRCRLIQLDPMLTPEITETGCNAYYVHELKQTDPAEQQKNLLRNYRRGIVFAGTLKKKGFTPSSILEFGPGSGYFAAGIQHIFPESRITVIDIVDKVLKQNRNVHGFSTIKGSPEEPGLFPDEKFDLIIARDILEHVTDIGQVIRNVAGLLKSGGYFHFLTPNGIEDVWGHWLHFIKQGGRSELLINHVNYFDGKGLRDLLENYGLHPVQYYTYQVKTILKGKGWRQKKSLSARSSTRLSAKNLLEQNPPETIAFEKKDVVDRWYLHSRSTFITLAWCRYKHHWWIKLPPSWNRGHEFYGLFRFVPGPGT